MKFWLLHAILLSFSFAFGDEEFSEAEKAGVTHGKSALEGSEPEIAVNDLKRFVTRLASDEFEGRGTGDPGERMATAYFATFLQGLGLQPEGNESSFFQDFTFRAGMELKGENSLKIEGVKEEGKLEPGEKYQPLSLSSSGKVDADVVFGGFGIEHQNHNSFDGLDVKGKWLLVLRGTPDGKKELKKFAPLVAKANLAKKKGAAGILFVKAANPAVGPELIPPTTSVGPANDILPAITISDDLATSLLIGDDCERDLKALFESYDKEERITGFDLPVRISSEIGVVANIDPGRNVLGRLVVGDEPSKEFVVIGGHIDHLGYGNRGGTRAKGEEATKLHPGADDNASGIAVIMELAQYFADQKKSGNLNLDRDIVFAAWSGEEVGLWGSRHYVKEARKVNDKIVYPGIAAYVNLDMVGRAAKKGLTLNGTGSSKSWKETLDAVTGHPDLKLKRSASPHIPSDASAFYLAGVPIIAAFTGTHEDYHTPRDTVDKIDFDGLEHITNYMKGLLVELAKREEAPDYVQVPRKQQGAAPRVKIGIRMEAADEGVLVTEVTDNSPAKKAGILAGDILSGLNGAAIKNMDGLFGELRKMKPDTEYRIAVQRGEKKVEMKITPQAR